MVFGPVVLVVVNLICLRAVRLYTFLLDHDPRDTYGSICRHLHGSKSPAFEAFTSQLGCTVYDTFQPSRMVLSSSGWQYSPRGGSSPLLG